MWFRRRSRGFEPVRAPPDQPPTNLPPVLLPPTEAGYLAARGLDDQARAMVQPDTLWEGSVPGYTAAQAVHTLAALRTATAQLSAFDPAAVAAAASAAAIAPGALRAVLLLSGRTTYDALRADRPYVAYDMARRLQLLAESAGGPRTWPGATSRALWTGQVADWSGFAVSTDRVGGLASVAPLVEDLGGLRPLPGADPTTPALRLLEPVSVAVVQRALRWAVVAAAVLLSPGTAPRSLDAELPRATGPAVTPSTPALDQMRRLDPLLMQRYDELRQVEGALVVEVGPSRRAGGHLDVRPDEAVVDGLLWRAATAVAAVARLGRRQLARRAGPLLPLAEAAYDLLEAVSTGGASWPEEAVRSLRRIAELALVLTASCHP